MSSTPHPTPADDLGLVVAIETSSRRASVAARLGDRSRSATLETDRAHASDLLPTLAALVTELGARPRDVRGVVVGTGPGSYTGLRVGLATAVGLARASGARILGVPSGEAQCFGSVPVGGEMTLLLDARSGEIYYARYRRTSGEVEVLESPCVLRPDEARARLVPDGPVFGDATVVSAAGLDPRAFASRVLDEPARASALLELGAIRLARGIESRLDTIEPLYLRPFAATERRSS